MSFTRFICIFCVLLLPACTATPQSTKSSYHKVRTYDQRKSSLGFAISPPSGEGWFEQLKDNSLIYLKKIPKSSYSISTQATELSLRGVSPQSDSLAEYVRQRKNPEARAKGNLLTSFQVSRDSQSPNCVSYMLKYEDHGVKNLKDNDFVKVADKGILCFHPDAPQHGIEVSYHERSLASAQNTSFRNEGEYFLASLQIRPVVE
jgi:hypothetical protein